MEFEIKEINNKEAWENFLLKCQEKTFLQSWNWGNFNERMGNKIWKLGIYEIANDKLQMANLLGITLVIKISAKRGTFLFIPHGPAIIRGRASVNLVREIKGNCERRKMRFY